MRILVLLLMFTFINVETNGQQLSFEKNKIDDFKFSDNRISLFEKSDTAIFYNKSKKKKNGSFYSKVLENPLPLLVGGIVLRGWDRQFYNMRHSYLPTFRSYKDTDLMYVPMIALLGLKICGVKGRSSWGRMLVSDAFSVAIMAATLNTLKETANVERPDKGDDLSFPSGHTTGAFMLATMLHKEYGHRSPLYSIGGYAAATTVGIMRIMNNRHWMSDVMFGAGLGILSTEAGYYFADLIFKNRGIHEQKEYMFSRNKSFISLNIGYCWMTEAHIAPHFEIENLLGSTMGVEGAWFFNDKWGAGAKFSISSMQMSTIDNDSGSLLQDITKQTHDFDPMNFFWGSMGVYRSFNISDRLSVTANINAGMYYRMKASVYPKNYLANPQSVFDVKSQYRVMGSTGASFSYSVKPMMAFRLYVDYSLVSARFVSTLYPNTENAVSFNKKAYLNQVTFGFSTSILLGSQK